MTTPMDAGEFLRGATAPIAAKWPTNKAKVEGTVIGWQMRQQTDMETREPMFFEGGKRVKQSALKYPATARPCMELLLDIQGEPTGITWETNQYVEKKIDDDTGLRRMYVSGPLQKAIGDAMAKAEATLEKGAYVEVVRTGVKKAAVGVAFTFAARWTKAADNTKAASAFLESAENSEAAESGTSTEADYDPWAEDSTTS